MRYFLLLLFSLFLNVNVTAKLDFLPNVVFITIDGASRSTFYALIARNKLPNISKMIKGGNYRNMDLDGYFPNLTNTYTAIWSGYYQDHSDVQSNYPKIPRYNTVFERLKMHVPSLQTAVMINHSIPLSAKERRPSLSAMIEHASEADNPYKLDILEEEKIRSSSEIGQLAASMVDHLEPPFVLMFNFTNVDFIGRRYREGADLYSQALKNCDYSLRFLIKAIENKDIWDDTIFIITSSHGYEHRSNKPSSKVWVASNQMIRYKGEQTSIVPTFFKWYDIPIDFFDPPLEGKPLVY